MSSALGLWNMNSSPRTVDRVNVCANTLLVLEHEICHAIGGLIVNTTWWSTSTQCNLLLTSNRGNFWKWKFQQNLLLVIHHVHTGPVDSNYNVILGQIRTYVKSQRHYIFKRPKRLVAVSEVIMIITIYFSIFFFFLLTDEKVPSYYDIDESSRPSII